MSGGMGNLALEGGDPRGGSISGFNQPTVTGTPGTVTTSALNHKLHDPNVSFEEYLYYAKISRENAKYEDQDYSMNLFRQSRYYKPDGADHGNAAMTDATMTAGAIDKELAGEKDRRSSNSPEYAVITEEEYVTASRAARNATWVAVFYLITTDILGPFSTPWAFWKLGYAPGTILYVIFGAFAGFGGYLLWRIFLGMDSDKYPLKTYGDIAFRVFGTVCRHGVNILQSVQLLFNVGIIVISNGQSLSQIANFNTCFIVLCIVWAFAGMILGQIRTLQRLGWLANAAIWMNLFVIFFTMGIVAHSPPNFSAGVASNQVALGPVQTTVGPGVGINFTGQVVGLMQAVYSYGGAMLFVEFMAEMRRPWDFWKGMLCAQTFIFFFYLLFGLFIYSYQGQFSINPAFQGISSYAWQTVANSVGLVSGLIAALLYGNIGIKVIYNNVLIDFFNFPSLITKKGKILWCAVVPTYWAVAFIISAAIPQVGNLGGLIAAVCILQFSYTFPPFFMIGYNVKKDAMLEGEGFNPETGVNTRHDSGMGRWIRGYKKQLLYNSFLTLFFLGSAATAVLGTYSAAVQIQEAYAAGSPPSFSCRSPLQPAS